MKKAAVINDLSSFGKCSLTAAIPVLSVLGVQCVPLPTAVLTGQTGYRYYHCTDLTDAIPLYIDAWKKNGVHFDAIYTGYVTGDVQVKRIMQFIGEFYEEGAFLLVDPVMGDDGAVYSHFTDELLEGMKVISRQAELITPNLTEACLLADIDAGSILRCTDPDELLEAAEELALKLQGLAEKPQDVIITGIKSFPKEKKQDEVTSGVCCDQEKPVIYTVAAVCDAASGQKEAGLYRTCTELIGQSFSGTGDLFASAICGLRLNQVPTPMAMEIAQRFISDSVRDTVHESGEAADRNDGVCFEKNLERLIGI